MKILDPGALPVVLCTLTTLASSTTLALPALCNAIVAILKGLREVLWQQMNTRRAGCCLARPHGLALHEHAICLRCQGLGQDGLVDGQFGFVKDAHFALKFGFAVFRSIGC